MRTIAIVGATSLIAQHCARIWSMEKPSRLLLIGRDGGKLDLVATDLRVRNPEGEVHTVIADFTTPEQIEAMMSKVRSFPTPDIALIAHGSLPDQAQCEAQIEARQAALVVNGVSAVQCAEELASAMRERGGHLAVIGSVAGDRGRKSNYVYGAAKGMVERYVEGLQHRYAGTGLYVSLVKPGPTATPMTAHLGSAKLADPADVAGRIVRGVKRRRAIIHAPPHWALIMMIVRNLPRFIFHRTNF